jgi:hypothetical protein
MAAGVCACVELDGSAARTGPAIDRARMATGSRENFSIVISELRRNAFVSRRTKTVCRLFRSPHKYQRYDFLAVITDFME